MKSTTRVELTKLLHGELDDEEAIALRRRLDADAELRVEYERLERAWRELELPAVERAPAGFAARVTAEARGRRGRGWLEQPWWAQATAAVALAGGVVLGLSLAASLVEDEWLYDATSEPTLAESYWLALDGEDDVSEAEL